MSNRGFTLVEVLIGLVVLAIGLLGLAKMNVVYVRATSQAHQSSEGVLLAQDKMEELRKYAISDQPGNYSVFDFDYLVSTDPHYSSVVDPPGSTAVPPPTVDVPGLCSGSHGGSPATTTGGTVYEVLYDDGSHGDVAAGDGAYSNSDTTYTATQAKTGTGGYTVNRVWSVKPITINGRTDYARLSVDANWVDQQNQPRTFHVESIAHRRQ